MNAPVNRTIEPLDIMTTPAALQLLETCKLDTSDIQSDRTIFLGATQDGRLVGVIGLELHGKTGLVRSMAVEPASRGQSIARELYAYLQAAAEARGLEALFLLTETAGRFFEAAGFSLIARDKAPPEIAATSQFGSLCPVSAALMGRDLSAPELATQ